MQHVIMNRNQQKQSRPCLAWKLDTPCGAEMRPWEWLLHPLAPQASCLLVRPGQAGILGEARLASDASSVSPVWGRAQQTCRTQRLPGRQASATPTSWWGAQVSQGRWTQDSRCLQPRLHLHVVRFCGFWGAAGPGYRPCLEVMRVWLQLRLQLTVSRAGSAPQCRAGTCGYAFRQPY